MRHLIPKTSVRTVLFGMNILRRSWPSLLISLTVLFVSNGCTGSGATPFPSGGLGLTKAEWEQHHTLISYDEHDSSYYYDSPLLYDDHKFGGYRIRFWYEGDR